MSEKRVKIQHIIDSQLPSYISEDFPLIKEFFSFYYAGLEYQGRPVDLINNIDQYLKLNENANTVDGTLLASDVDDNQDFIDVYNTDGFPEAFGVIQVNDEIILYQAKTSTRFLFCKRGFSGITSYDTQNGTEEAVFSESEAAAHNFRAPVKNLSALFLQEFLKKIKGQFLPGLQTQELPETLNQAQFIRQSRDLYSARGTESSFKILFKALYNVDADIIRPQDFLITPSNASFQLTRDLIVEPLEGNPENLINATLFQDEFDNIKRAYAPISYVQKISVGVLTDRYFKVSIDSSYNKYDGSQELLYGEFSPHAKTRIIDSVAIGQTFIDVDSTIGFPKEGTLSVNYKDGTTGIVTYTDKTINQFLGIGANHVGKEIDDNTTIDQNTFVYGYDPVSGSDSGIKVKIRSVLNKLQDSNNAYYQPEGAKVKIKSFGKVREDLKSNNWVFNTAQYYDVLSLKVEEASNSIYRLETKDPNILRIGDIVELTDDNLTKRPNDLVVTDVYSATVCLVRGSGVGDPAKIIKVGKRLTKFKSDLFTGLESFNSNILNTYVDKDKVLIAANSLPSYLDTKVGPNRQKFTISGTFDLGQELIPITTATDHNFYTGDLIYYTPQKNITSITQPDGSVIINEEIVSAIFPEGIYVVKRVDEKNIKFAKSKSNLFAGKFESVTPAGGVNNVVITDNTIEREEFKNKNISPQKIYREISNPVIDSKEYQNNLKYSGIFVNGVELLNYKSSDFVHYNEIRELEVVAGGSDYDVINPPLLHISDSTGVGATGICAVNGGLSAIEVLDPGFDYVETPQIKITGGNGVGAKAEANLISVTNEISFNATGISTLGTGIGGITTSTSTIGFTTFHRFRNGERVTYNTFGKKAVTGLTTGATYYTEVLNEYDVKLHNTLNSAIAGSSAGINTVTIGLAGEGVHTLKSLNNKLTIGSINVINSGVGYENKQRTCGPAGVSTSLDFISIKNHDYKTGEIVRYTTDGTVISGLTNQTEYYVTAIDADKFKLSQVGVGTTAKDFFIKTDQFVELTSVGSGIHNFNYQPISVEVTGKVGIASTAGSEFKATVQPLFRGQISSIHITNTGVGYGASDIINFKRDPEIKLKSGVGAQLRPIIDQVGRIRDVIVNRTGEEYNSSPHLIITDGTGSGEGALLIPEIVNGNIVSVRVAKSGVGYGVSTTSIQVVPAGEGAQFSTKLQTWELNTVQKGFESLTSDDIFISESNNSDYGLQFSYAYSPRELRKIQYAKDSNGSVLYGKKDLTIRDNQEIDNTDHSSIIGWSYDGYPIYGPYAYERSTGGDITQMKSGYVVELQPNRPPVSVFPREFFIEDFKWVDSTDESVLDRNNGRFCVTPDFPNGTYAYFTTFDLTAAADGVFKNFKRPAFPYVIGEYFKAKPNAFNYDINSNQDNYDINATNWRRNTAPYSITKKNSGYDYLQKSYEFIDQDSVISTTEKGYITDVGIVTSGSNYKINDRVVFESEKGFFSAARISRLDGVSVSNVSFAKTTISNIEFFPTGQKKSFVGISSIVHNFKDGDVVSISGLSTTSSLIEGTYATGISTYALRVSQTIPSVSAVGIITYISVYGRGLDVADVQENDIISIGTGSNEEQVRVLNIDRKSSRLRVLRGQNGKVGVSHTITTIIKDNPKRFNIVVENEASFFSRRNREYYFDPNESLGIGTQSGPGFGKTVTFASPGVGETNLFIPTQQVFLPNHGLATGDEVIYKTHGGDPIGIASISDTSSMLLGENSRLYVANLSPDFIGVSSVPVGLGSTGVYVGTASTNADHGLLYFTGIGTGTRHSFVTDHKNVIKGSVDRDLVTVSTASTHGLVRGDTVYVDVNPSISTTRTVRYNESNRKMVIGGLDFVAAGVALTTNSITVSDHRLITGQKIIHSGTSAGLTNDKEYYAYVVDKDNVKLCDTKYQTKQSRPEFVNITSRQPGTLFPVNPPIEVYRDSTVVFDLSSETLSYLINTTPFPGFLFKLYTDSAFTQEYETDVDGFVFTTSGTPGQSGATATLTVNKNTPKTLYYRLEPIRVIGNKSSYLEIVSSDEVDLHNQINIKDSVFDGKYTISGVTGTTYEYSVSEKPEAASYSGTTSVLSYTTDSLTASGPISALDLKDRRKGYSRLPGISTITTSTGTGAILKPSSTTIGKVVKTKLENIGFNYPSDLTLSPEANLPQVLELNTFFGFSRVGITSFGRGYTTPPTLIVLDGTTQKQIDDIDLRYVTGSNVVPILKNTLSLSGNNPTIRPIKNSNGIRVSNLVYDDADKTVTVTMKKTYSENFPIEVGDKILVENSVVTVDPDADVNAITKGFNSEDYDYKLFNVTGVTANLGGGIGIVTYSFNEFSGLEVAGIFDTTNSSATIVPERLFPVFNFDIKSNSFQKGSVVTSGDLEGTVADWDETNQLLTLESSDDFSVGDIIEEDVTGSKATVNAKYEFKSEYDIDYFSKVDNGWRTENGFLSKIEQRLPDNDYYQNFSYSIKSKVPFQKWNDSVSSLLHSAGFKKFSDLQVESLLPLEDEDALEVVPTDATSIQIDLVNVYDLECVANFDLVTENYIGGANNKYSDEITFKTRIISDFTESISNRVLLIDDISGQFNSNARGTPFQEVNRHKLEDAIGAKFVILVKDKLFTGERQVSLVSVINNVHNGQAMISQYGDTDTELELGTFDYVVDGLDGVLNFYPDKFEVNNYNLSIFSYNLERLDLHSETIGIGSTQIGLSTTSGFPGALVSLASTNHIIAGAAVTTVFTLAGIGTTTSGTRAAKILFSIENSNNEAEFEEVSIVCNGTNVEFIEYGQLTTHSLDATSSGTTGLGTYGVTMSGSDIVVKFTPYDAGITTTYLNALSIGISSEKYVGVGTQDYTHAQLIAEGQDIAASGSPSAVGVGHYANNINVGIDGCYGIVVVTDTTNNISQISEIVVVDNDSDVFLTEFGIIDSEGNTGVSGLGTLGANRLGTNTTQIVFTPNAGIACHVKTYLNTLSVNEIVTTPDLKDMQSAFVESHFSTYTGTKNTVKKDFELTHKNDNIFQRSFDSSDSAIVNISENTIKMPNHFFVSGQALTYNSPLGIKTDAISIASTDAFPGVGATTLLPADVFCIKVNENFVKIAATAEHALAKNPVSIAFTGNGIQNFHTLTAKDANQKVMLTIDNMLQSPISETRIVTELSAEAAAADEVVEFAGITSIFAGDYVRVGAADTGEILKIVSIGIGKTNGIKVERSWVGTKLNSHGIGSTVTKLRGHYNIVDNTVHFVEAPYGNRPIGSISDPPSFRDWIGVTSSSTFSGRSFIRNAAIGSTEDPYSRNFLYDDITNQFNGSTKDFTLTQNDEDVSGVSTSTIVAINGIYQGLGANSNYTVTEEVGVTTISFTGTASSAAHDVNTANVPRGGVIVSVASSAGFGFQPLVAAGATVVINGSGQVSSVAIGNSGSGYRSGIQTTVNVGVAESSTGTPQITFIGTASVIGGHVVSIALTNPGAGFTQTNPPDVFIDPPLSYVNVPLIYSAGSTGLGTGAKVDIVVGNGSSVIDFEVSNTGFGYGNSQVLTVGVGGTVGIPTDPHASFDSFRLIIDEIDSDQFTGWSVGDWDVLDDFSNLFTGSRQRFPLKKGGNFISFVARQGSNINIQDNIFIFLNDVLQVPGVGYEFSGGSQILFTEPPDEGDSVKVIFYRGSSAVDTQDVDITETVKIGDSLDIDSSVDKLDEDPRTVQDILTTNVVNTDAYNGAGLSEDETLERPVKWCRQRDDIYLDGRRVSKARPLYEPSIFPAAYIIKSVGVGSTEIYVDNVRPSFNQDNESTVSTDFQKKLTIVNYGQKVSAAATAVVSSAGTVSSIVLSTGGVGYSTTPDVSVQNPVGLGTTQRAVATASITAGIVTTITVSSGGTEYTQANPPIVLISPPKSLTEEDNTVVSFAGDFGVITGFGTTTVGVASTGITLDLIIEKDSPLRDNTKVTQNTTISGIQTGDYFIVYDSNITHNHVGSGITALDEGGNVIGVGTTFIDNIYRVAHHVAITTSAIGYGATAVRRVTVSVEDFSGVGVGTSVFAGRFSWGKIEFSERVGVATYGAITNNGVVGIRTGPYITRQQSLKSIGFVT